MNTAASAPLASGDSSATVLPQLPPQAGVLKPFTAAELAGGPVSPSYVNRKLSISQYAVHPLGASVEYPGCGSEANSAVGHFFDVDPRPDGFVHPAENVQYSFTDNYSHKEGISGRFLGVDVKIDRKSYSCRGIKSCERTPASIYAQSHCSTSLADIAASMLAAREAATLAPAERAHHDLIQKTAAFFHSLSILGCAYGASEDDDADHPVEEGLVLPSRSARRKQCAGSILLERSHDTGSFYLRCELRKPGNTAHFFSGNIGSYDLQYLDALLRDDRSVIDHIEKSAFRSGHGPLAPCTFVCSSRSTRGICPYVHRDEHGRLNYGILVDQPCGAKADWFMPSGTELMKQPRILLVVHGFHNHVPPPPTHTPTPYLRIVHWLLSLMEHRVAIATPRALMRDEAVRAGVKRILQLPYGIVPCVTELHPSLDNYDHLDGIIKSYRTRAFPFGTDWQGTQDLFNQHKKLPSEYRYVRRVEEIALDEGNGTMRTVRFVVCMLAAMSAQFLRARVLEQDTSHKRVRNWLELTLGEWRNDLNRSVTLARVFWDSQSAKAHCQALELIWDVIKEDTGRVPMFRHLCTAEEQLTLWLIELMLVDDHKGQALGVGLFLMKIAASFGDRSDLFEPARRLSDLGAYDHLRRMLRMCITHYVRHVRPFRGKETDGVYRAMLSLASADELPHFEQLVALIRNDGSKDAQNWLSEKEASDRCGLRALYQPISFIPAHIWKSAPSSTNARESAQGRDILSGKGLNLVGGIITAWFDDRDEMKSLASHLSFGISRHYTEPTAAHRAMTSLVRNAKQGKRTADEADVNLAVTVGNIKLLRGQVQAAAAAVDTASTAAVQAKRQRQHDSALEQLQDHTSRLPGLIAKSSGRVHVDIEGAQVGEERSNLCELFRTRSQLENHLGIQKAAMLKVLCSQAKLKTTGRKDEMVSRLLDKYYPTRRGGIVDADEPMELTSHEEALSITSIGAAATVTLAGQDPDFPVIDPEQNADDSIVPIPDVAYPGLYESCMDMLLRD